MPPEEQFLHLKPLQDILLLINPGEAQGTSKLEFPKYQCKWIAFKVKYGPLFYFSTVTVWIAH